MCGHTAPPPLSFLECDAHLSDGHCPTLIWVQLVNYAPNGKEKFLSEAQVVPEITSEAKWVVEYLLQVSVVLNQWCWMERFRSKGEFLVRKRNFPRGKWTFLFDGFLQCILYMYLQLVRKYTLFSVTFWAHNH
jgi:hypothetical protein